MESTTSDETQAPEADRIRGFWEWWATARDELTAAAREGDAHRCAELLTPAMQALEPELFWEVGQPGDSITLTVTSVAPEHRPLARRWLKAAPADSVWKFQDLKPAADITETTLDIEGVAVPFADFRVRTAQQGAALDVQVYHPVLATLEPVEQVQVIFVALDLALGQREVELWIGASVPQLTMPEDPRTLAQLRAEVEVLAEQSMPGGVMDRTVVTVDAEDGPVLVDTLVRPLSVLAPELDQHVQVRVPFSAQTRQGQPAPGALAALRALEDDLREAMGSDGLLVSHETAHGVRTLHLYVDSTVPVTLRVAQALATWEDGETTVEVAADPAWNAVRAFAC